MSGSPGLGFLFRHPAHFIALGFGAGLSPVAPGTMGTLVAIPMALLLRAYGGEMAYVAVVVLLLAIGAWAAHVTGRSLGVPDSGAIVIDEIAAFLLVLFFVGPGWVRVVIAFAIFRAFDIFKPPPIRQLDASMKNGVGVMLDDVLAAGYTLVVLALLQRVFG